MHTELLTKLCNGNLQSFIFAVFAFDVQHTDTNTAPALPNTCRGTLRIVGKNMHPNKITIKNGTFFLHRIEKLQTFRKKTFKRPAKKSDCFEIKNRLENS